MKTIRIDKFGRLLIPKPVRERLGWGAGSEVTLEEGAESVRLKTVEGEAIIAAKEGILVYRGTPAGDLEEAVKSTRRRRYEAVGGLDH